MPYKGRDSFVDAVREATDIVEVIGRSVDLRRKGRSFWGLCPFHQEKTPSFSVDPDRQLFYCFGCHAGGTVFTFLTQLEGLEFRHVVENLAEEAGITPPAKPEAQSPEELVRQRIRVVSEWSREYFLDRFDQFRQVVHPYLAGRRVSDSLIERFEIGFAPEQWDGLYTFLTRRGVKPEEMEKAGVVVKRREGSGYFDRWRGRVMFPIWDRDGKVVAFGGRSLLPEQEPKYLNSPDTELFHKGRILYASHLARPAWRRGVNPLLVEGYFDVLACHGAGLNQAVASLGTALTEYHGRYLARYADEVDMLYDQDAAGQDAMKRAYLILSKVGLKVNAVSLPKGKDPDETVQVMGIQSLVSAVENRVPYLEYVLRRYRHSPEAMSPRGKARAVEELRPLWKVIPDPVEKEGYLETIAKALKIQVKILSQSFGASQGLPHTFAKNRHNMEVMESAKKSLPALDVRLISALIRHSDWVDRVRDRLPQWTDREEIAEALSAIQSGQLASNPARWVEESASSGAKALVIEAMKYEGPDGGNEAIEDYLCAIEYRQDQTRWQELIERVRSGENDPDLMSQVKLLQRRVQYYRGGKEG